MLPAQGEGGHLPASTDLNASANRTSHAFVGGHRPQWMIDTPPAPYRNRPHVPPSTQTVPTVSVPASNSPGPALTDHDQAPATVRTEGVLPSPVLTNGSSPQVIDNVASPTYTRPVQTIDHAQCPSTEEDFQALDRHLDALVRDLDADQASGDQFQPQLPPTIPQQPQPTAPEPRPIESQPPAKRRRTEPTANPAASQQELMQSAVRILERRASDSHHAGHQGMAQTCEALTRALNIGDLCFVFLHRLFCIWLLDRQAAERVTAEWRMELSADQLNIGLQLFSSIIWDVRKHPQDHIVWLSRFPVPPEHPTKWSNLWPLPARQSCSFLRVLGLNWDRTVQHVKVRRCPLLVHDISGLLRCPSDMIAHLLFKASIAWLGVRDKSIRNTCLQIYAQDYRFESERMTGRLHQTVVDAAREDIKSKLMGIIQNARSLPTPSNSAHSEYLGQTTLLTGVNGQASAPYYHSSSTLSAVFGQQYGAQTPAGYPMQFGVPANFEAGRSSQFSGAWSQVPGQQGNQPFTPGIANLDGQALPSPNAGSGSPVSGNQTGTAQSPWALSTVSMPISNHGPGMITPPAIHQVQTAPVARPPAQANAVTESAPPQSSNSGFTYNQALMNQPQQARHGPQLQSPLAASSSRPRGRPRLYPPETQVIPHSDHPTEPHGWISLKPGLHLLHLRSPERSPANLAQCRFLQFVESLPVFPTAIKPQLAMFRFRFDVSNEDYRRIVTVSGRPGSMQSTHTNGSIRYRLRVSSAPASRNGVPTKHEWTIMNTSWPQHFFAEINETPLQPPRKSHFHNDLPIDITQGIRPGENLIRINVPEYDEDAKGQSFFAAVERLVFLTQDYVRELIRCRDPIPAADTRAEITRRMRPTGTDDLDTGSGSFFVSVSDPFSSTLYKTPVRGRACTHLDCFDLDTWLTTRPKKQPLPSEPTQPDAWRCPVCSKDARPNSLRVDEYFSDVRQQLMDRDLGRVKRIEIHADGTWTAEEEPDDDGDEDGDDDGTPLLGKALPAAGAGAAGSRGSTRPPPEVIELLDDD